MKFLRLIFFIIISTFVYSCRPNVSGIWQNERIDAAIRDSIKIQNEKVFKALLTNDVTLFKSTWSDTLLNTVAPQIAKQHLEMLRQAEISDTSYEVIGEYYALLGVLFRLTKD